MLPPFGLALFCSPRIMLPGHSVPVNASVRRQPTPNLKSCDAPNAFAKVVRVRVDDVLRPDVEALARAAERLREQRALARLLSSPPAGSRPKPVL